MLACIRRNTLALVCVVVVAATSLPALGQNILPPFKNGEFLIKFKGGINTQKAIQGLATDEAKVDTVSKKNNILLVRMRQNLDYSQTINQKNAFSKIDSIERVEPNYIYRAIDGVCPNDSRIGEQWYLRAIRAPEAWKYQRDSEGIVVAVVDTGVFMKHEDLSDNMWENLKPNRDKDNGKPFLDDHGADFFNNDGDPSPDMVETPVHPIFCDFNREEFPSLFSARRWESHGTHVAGIIGAIGDNNNGISGISWKIKIMPLKFLGGSCSSGTLANALRAIEYAIDHEAKIINNSWGGPYSDFLRDAISEADRAGILVVAAAGNEGRDNDIEKTVPSGYDLPNVLSVAASTKDDSLAEFSNYGRISIDIAAPGADILSTVPLGNGEKPESGYMTMSGTSMATPIVSGAAALVMAKYPNLTHYEVKELLIQTADPILKLHDKIVSGGRLNVARALQDQPLPQGFVRTLDALPADLRERVLQKLSPLDRVRIFLHADRFKDVDRNLGAQTTGMRGSGEANRGVSSDETFAYELMVSLNPGIEQAQIPNLFKPLKVEKARLAFRRQNIYEITVITKMTEIDLINKVRRINGVRHVETNKIYTYPRDFSSMTKRINASD
jgi:subtilisin family serine protease